MGNEFGDTLVACVECGAVFVAEKVTKDEGLVETAAKTGRPFVGSGCPSCRSLKTEVTGTPFDSMSNPGRRGESSWRLLKGPLRVPRKS